MKKTIKVDEGTLEELSDLKDWYANKYPYKDFTYDLVINHLMYDHKQYTDPEIQRHKEVELLKDTVSKKAYNNLEARSIGWMEKYLTLERENRNKKVEIDDREKSLSIDLRDQQDSYKKLQIELANKEKKISLLNTRIGELLHKIDGIKTDLMQLPYGLGDTFIDKYFKSPPVY